MIEASNHKRIFITGATGVVGRLVVPELVRRGHTVTAAGRNSLTLERLRAAGAATRTIDLFDAPAVRRAIAGHEVVINLATHMPPSLFRMGLPWEWRENDRVRRDGSAALVEAALAEGVQRFIQESFASVYEDGGDDWIDETWPMRPARYNRTVLDAERSAQRMTAAGKTGVVLRFAGFYGPDDILRQTLDVVRRGWSPMPGARDAYWSSVSHEDAANAVVAALGVDAGVYNVCDDEPLTRREWADAAAAAVGARPPKLIPRWLARICGSQMELLSRSQRMSNGKLKRASGWSPRWPSARDGLVRAVRSELPPGRRSA